MKTPCTAQALVGRGAKLFAVVLIVATVAPQILSVKTVSADDGGYPWVDATQLFTTPVTYEWGYSTCPANDTGCMGMTKTYNSVVYGEEDAYTMNLRNCTSYAAWKINQYISQSFASWGNASNWHNKAPSGSVKTPSTYTPVFGDLALWDSAAGGLGHVAFVYAVSQSGIASLDDYNSGYPLDANGHAQWGLFYSGETTASSSLGTPSEYLHFNGITNTAVTTVAAVSSQLTAGGVMHVFTGTPSGNVYDTSWGGGTTLATQQVGFTLGNAVTSLSSQYVGGVVHVYAATNAGSIDDIFWGGGQTLGQLQKWSNGASGDVISSQVDSNGYQHVLVGTAAGNVYDIYWVGTGTPGSQQVGFTLGKAVNSLSSQYVGGVMHVYAATNAGSIDDIYWGDFIGPAQRQVWTNGVSGDVITSLVDSGGYQHVETGTSSGNVYDTYWTGTGMAASQQVGFTLGNPITSLSAQYPGGVVHVYAATNAGSIDDIFWGGGQALSQLQKWSNGVSGDGISSLVDGSGVQHVSTAIPSGSAYDTTWTGTGAASTQQVK